MSQQPVPVPAHLNLDNIQGDILSGLPKRTQAYLFFRIVDVPMFRRQLAAFAPLVTTVAQVLKDREAIESHKRRGHMGLLPLTGVNISFTHKGFVQMSIDDKTLTQERDAAGHNPFEAGQRADAQALGDKGTGTGAAFVPDWDQAFLQDIHGVILVSGDSRASVDKKLADMEAIFSTHAAAITPPKRSISMVTLIKGDVRPGAQKGHEHFGFLDGISNPSIIGFDTNPNPGPRPVRAGVLLAGHDGDPAQTREAWAVDGSFLAFRYLFQKVPEFNNFLQAKAEFVPGVTETLSEQAELLGARLVGRWKSGAPIDLTPFNDDPHLAADPKRNNDFRFAAETDFQKICPFAAHVRKTNPRADLEDHNGISIEKNRITRRGIQFGPELTREEQAQGAQTQHGRGLLFACYQTSLANGFEFIQKSWANNAGFPPFQNTGLQPGLDPIIGQGDRKLSGTDPNNPATVIAVPDFVVPRGGEYFFSPSLKGLKETIALSHD